MANVSVIYFNVKLSSLSHIYLYYSNNISVSYITDHTNRATLLL